MTAYVNIAPMTLATPMATNLKTRFLGNCQLCENDQKLHNGRMVHHGYTRPGDGFIVGDCPGVGVVPYEVSCDAIKKYKRDLENQLSFAKDRARQLEARTVTEITYINWRTREVEKYAVGVTALYAWENEYQSAEYETRASVDRLTRAIKRCAERIAAWKPAPIRTVEEEARKAEAVRAETRAARQAAREARQAKKAATKAKQDALQARRQAAFNAFEAKIIAASTLPEGERAQAVHAIRAERRLKKNEWMWHFDFSPAAGQALLALNMGHRGHNNVVYMD